MNINDFFKQLDEMYVGGDLVSIEHFILNTIEELKESGSSKLTLCSVYNELAGFYRGISRFSESLDAFMSSLEILEEVGLKYSEQSATIMINAAGTCRLTGDSEVALSMFLVAKEILDQLPKRDPYIYASLCNNLALLYLEKGDTAEAKNEADVGYEMVCALPDSEHEQATALVNFASIAMADNDMPAAEKYMLDAMVLYEKLPHPNVHYAAALNMLGSIRSRQKDYRGALEVLKQSLDYTHHFFGENIEAAIVKQGMAHIHAQLGEMEEARKLQAQAAEDFDRLLGPEHERAVYAHKLLEDFSK